jgi:hypothetical protein
MADDKSEWTLELKDEVSGAAASAANALEDLRTGLQSDTRALAEMQKAMRNLQQGSVVNVKQFQALKAAIDAKKQSISTAQTKFLAMGGTFNKTGAAAKATESRFHALRQAAESMGGSKILNALKSVTVVLGGLLAATGAAVVALVKYGIAVGEVRRAEHLRLEGLTKMRNYMGLAAGNADQMQGAIDRVSGSMAQGRDEIAGYTEKLYRMGLRGTNLEAALEGYATKMLVVGSEEADRWAGHAAGIAVTGGNVRKFADDVKARLGGVAAKYLTQFDVQMRKFHENWATLFTGLKIEALQKARGMVFELFSQATPAGKALRQMFTILFQPLVDGATACGPVLKKFFQGIIIFGQRLVISFLEVRLSMRNTFGDVKLFKGLDGLKLALRLGVLAAFAFTTALVVSALWIGSLLLPVIGAAIVSIMSFGFTCAGAAIGVIAMAWPLLLAGAALWGLYKIGELVYTLWKEIDWTDLGRSIWKGIVNGLSAAKDAIGSIMTELGEGAMTAFKSVLGIASPSKAFMQLGLAIPAGVQAGIEQGSPAAQATAAAVVPPPFIPAPGSPGSDEPATSAPGQPPAPPSGAQRPAAAGAAAPVTIGEIHIHTDAKDPAGHAAAFKRELANILEAASVQMGAGAPANG